MRFPTIQFHMFLNVKLLSACLSAIVIVVTITAVGEYWLLGQRDHQLIELQSHQQSTLDTSQSAAVEIKTLTAKNTQLEAQFTQAQADADHQKYAKLDTLFTHFQSIEQKVVRNTNLKLDVSATTNLYTDWGAKLLHQQYDPLEQSLTDADTVLDKQYQTYQAALVTPTPTKAAVAKTTTTSSAAGYSQTTVATSRGNFKASLVKMALSAVTVKTVSASSTDCTNQCPTKSLAGYVAESGAYAGINGTYFCPPDYSWCSGKTNSFDFAVYNSLSGHWLNQGALGWNSEGLATFNGHSAKFYRYASDFAGGAVTAAIANFPPLLVQNGNVVISDGDLDSAQKSKGLRGALGTDGTNVYLAVVSSASVLDAAYVMQSLGAKDVLNLDGGGSAALYVAGSYKVGPGRSLPNAVVLTQ